MPTPAAPPGARWPPAPGSTWILDLDGVVWLQGQPIAGAAHALAVLGERGDRVLFATNNSVPTVAELCRRLAGVGVDVSPQDVLSSAQSAARLIRSGERVLAVGGPGLREALRAAGAELVERSPADVVMVGWSKSFGVDEMTRAMAAVRAGARFIGTNEDATFPTPDGLLPGSGAFLAAIATASGATPQIAGKPHQPMVDLIQERAGAVHVAVGDRPATDGALARRLGVPFALVLSGVTGPGDEVGSPAPDAQATDLGALVSSL